MVSKQQKDMRKKKKRAALSHQKVLVKRKKLRDQAKAEKEEWKNEKRIMRLQRDLDRFESGVGVPVEGLPEDTMKQLEHNVEILKTLEKEHARNKEDKQKLNEDLESQGHKTLQEKLKALHDKVAADQVKREMGVGGEATCKMSAIPPPPSKPKRKRSTKEVSDVEVVKAPQIEES